MTDQQHDHGPGAPRAGRRPFRPTARAVGAIYLAGMVLGVTGNLMILSVLGAPDPMVSIAANSTLLAVGAVLWLLTVVGDAAHGVLMYPVLRPHGERMAIGYLAARIVDATLVALMTLLIVVQIPLGLAHRDAGATQGAALTAVSGVLVDAKDYAYEFGMIALAISGLLLCLVLYRARLLPRLLAGWGLLGYGVLLGGSVLQVLGVQLSSVHTAPGGLWEVFVGVWLVMKGFSAAAVASSRPPQPGRAPEVPAQIAVAATT